MTSMSKKTGNSRVRLSALFIAIFFTVTAVFMGIKYKANGEGGDEVLMVERQNLLQHSASVHVNWLRTLNPYIEDTEGDLVWNSEKQQGVMHFVDLPVSKESEQYHLWVYDLHQPQEKPISAGIFVIKQKNEDVYITVKPEQEIKKPYKFLLTLEKVGDTTFSNSQSLLLAQP